MTPDRLSNVKRLDLTTGEMLRAGRAIARLEQVDLARAAGVSLETVKRLERIRGPVNASVRTLRALTAAFETRNVQFFSDDSGHQCVCKGEAGREPDWTMVEPPLREPDVVYRALYHSAATPESLTKIHTVLDDVLQAATVINAKLGVTGALLAANGRFLQALEGPRSSVFQLLGRIAMDGRHSGFTPLECAPTDDRRFGDWLMAAGSSPAPVSAELGEFEPEALSPGAALDLLMRVSAEERAALA